MGLLKLGRRFAESRLRLDVVDEHHVLSDCRFRSPDKTALGLPRGDMVYPPGADSVLLAEASACLEGDSVLDLCTGSGVQCLCMASRARQVIGVDIEARAVSAARANAVLNDIDNCQFRVGDLYRPVRGERFDLVLANPPFVAGPQRGPSYHSGGAQGDRVLKVILQGFQDHLQRGGKAAVISHVALRRGESIQGRLRSMLQGFAGRVLGLVLESGSVIDLAVAQSVFALDRGFNAYAREVHRWVRYLRLREINEIALVLLAAERGGRFRLEVRAAPQLTLPLPLSRAPREQVADWLGARGLAQG
jgi:methylase of polypeptide subunit release factors